MTPSGKQVFGELDVVRENGWMVRLDHLPPLLTINREGQVVATAPLCGCLMFQKEVMRVHKD